VETPTGSYPKRPLKQSLRARRFSSKWDRPETKQDKGDPERMTGWSSTELRWYTCGDTPRELHGKERKKRVGSGDRRAENEKEGKAEK